MEGWSLLMSKMLVAATAVMFLLSGCEGQTETRVFVTNSAGVISARYNPCQSPGAIRELRLADETSTDNSLTLWKLVLAEGPGVDSIPFGTVPKGYREVAPYQAKGVHRPRHLAVDIIGVDGYHGGIAGDFLSLTEGRMLWSMGQRKGTDLNDISKATFGCG